jgi:hypothetical protein
VAAAGRTIIVGPALRSVPHADALSALFRSTRTQGFAGRFGPNCALRLTHSVRPWPVGRGAHASSALGWCATRRDFGGGLRRVAYFLLPRTKHPFAVYTPPLLRSRVSSEISRGPSPPSKELRPGFSLARTRSDALSTARSGRGYLPHNTPETYYALAGATADRTGPLRYSLSLLFSLFLRHSSYFRPLGMVAPLRDLGWLSCFRVILAPVKVASLRSAPVSLAPVPRMGTS